MPLHSYPGCPTPATLAAIADGSLPPPERDAAAAHIADCERCLVEVAAIVRLGRAEPSPLPAVLRDRVSRRPRASWQTAAAVAATLVVGVGGWWLGTAGDRQRPAIPATDDAVRSQSAGPALPLVTQPQPQARLSRRDLTFTWQPVIASLSYRVRVMRDDGQLLWEGESTGTTMRMADAAALPTAVPLYVAVTALLPDGRTTRAPAVPFTILRE